MIKPIGHGYLIGASGMDRRVWYRAEEGTVRNVMVASISGGCNERIVPEGKRVPSLMKSNAMEF